MQQQQRGMIKIKSTAAAMICGIVISTVKELKAYFLSVINLYISASDM